MSQPPVDGPSGDQSDDDPNQPPFPTPPGLPHYPTHPVSPDPVYPAYPAYGDATYPGYPAYGDPNYPAYPGYPTYPAYPGYPTNAGHPIYPGFAAPAGDPRFLPGDPLVSPDFAGWWARGFAITRRAWRPLALVQVLTAVPALMLLIPAQIFVDLTSQHLADGPTTDNTEGLFRFLGAGLISYVALFLASLISAFGTMACVRLVVNVALGQPARAGQALRSVLPRLPALIGWSLLGGLLGALAVLACFVPVLYVLAALAVLPVVVLFEPGAGISRCFQLFHTDLGAAVARVATIGGLGLAATVLGTVLGAVASVITQAAAGTASIVAGSVAGTVLTSAASMMGGIVLTPLIVATYADLRARREPFTTAYLAAG